MGFGLGLAAPTDKGATHAETRFNPILYLQPLSSL